MKTVREPNENQLKAIMENLHIADGELVWKKPAGYMSNGYHVVNIGGERFHVPMIGYFLIRGEWPSEIVRYRNQENMKLKEDSLWLGKRISPMQEKSFASMGYEKKMDGWYLNDRGPFKTLKEAVEK